MRVILIQVSQQNTRVSVPASVLGYPSSILFQAVSHKMRSILLDKRSQMKVFIEMIKSKKSGLLMLEGALSKIASVVSS